MIVRVPTANTVLARSSATTPQDCNKTSLAGNANAHMNMARKQAKFAVIIPGEFLIQSPNGLMSTVELYACLAMEDQTFSALWNIQNNWSNDSQDILQRSTSSLPTIATMQVTAR